MNIKECLQKDIDKLTEEYQKKLMELNRVMAIADKLPDEIKQINDCTSAWGFTYSSIRLDGGELYVIFDSDETIKQLKMMGVQGFKTSFYGGYFHEPDKWMWNNGSIKLSEHTTINFSGGHPQKPPQCIIEEYEEAPKNTKPEKRLRAICTETGKEI
jgi:hypothetical protein